SQDVTASSLLGALTSNSATNYLSLPYNNDLLFSIVVDNNRKLHGEIVDDLPGAIRFPCETIALIVYPQMDQMGNPVVLLFGEACDPLTEWYCTAQLRIKCGPGQHCEHVVDRGVFHFGKRAHPISIQIRDSRVKRIKFELRFVTKVYESLPRFESGDITIKFKFGDTMQADKSLLALHSSYMATKLKDASPDAVVELGDFEREAFIELLYQIYDTIRPISANFILLSKAAVAYRAERILERITSYLLSLDVDLEQKLRAAVELELDDALREIVFRAEQRGEWTQIISKGFEPSSLGREVYRQIVCPAIIEAKVRRYGYPFKKYENIIELGKSNPPYTVPMKLVDKTLHINRGIIELHNTKGFIMRNSNEIELRQSAELGVLCIRAGITVADLIELMFRHIYPQRDLVPAHCLRPMMLLAHNNGMCKLLDSLGNALSLEPPITTEVMLEHFELADRYQHSNLLQASLLRIEGSFRGKASRLVTLPRFKNLAEEIKMQILDRHCSGWALFDKCLAGRPTKRIRRVLTLGSGGPLESECDSETSLQYTEESLSVEAFGAPQDVIIN
uniref:BTB domain-containing protein n=1 Tax=Parascaris univalens TaxID=6257 RepID=A0A915A0A8_PARUN